MRPSLYTHVEVFRYKLLSLTFNQKKEEEERRSLCIHLFPCPELQVTVFIYFNILFFCFTSFTSSCHSQCAAERVSANLFNPLSLFDVAYFLPSGAEWYRFRFPQVRQSAPLRHDLPTNVYLLPSFTAYMHDMWVSRRW